MDIDEIKINSEKLRYIKTHSKYDSDYIELMLRYAQTFSKYAPTPEMRSYWAILYVYLDSRYKEKK